MGSGRLTGSMVCWEIFLTRMRDLRGVLCDQMCDILSFTQSVGQSETVWGLIGELHEI
jgi:hypothetical protein